jgi:hypothetical protein
MATSHGTPQIHTILVFYTSVKINVKLKSSNMGIKLIHFTKEDL